MKPEYVKIGDKQYKINTDFRIALECNKIALNEDIGEYERALAVIYKLFSDEGLDNPQDHDKLLELGQKYLLCGNEEQSDTESNMDFEQDRGLIKASFFSDYKVEDVFSRNMHWWDFCDYLNGLTEDCVLNRVRFIRDYDIDEIKDDKEKKKWIKQKESVALKKKEKPLTSEEKEKLEEFYKISGYKKG